MPTTTKIETRRDFRVRFENIVLGTVLPFKEKPAPNKHSSTNFDQLSAEDLFSKFTADIIKENVAFKR
jgi:hypothetical protein